MDKEVVVHVHNGILFCYKKEHIWVCSNEVDELRAYYTEWSKSEIQTLYINACIWNLERWHWWSYMQGSKGDTDIMKRLLGSVGGGEGGMIWENSTETYISPFIKQTANSSLMYDAGHPKPVSRDNLEEWGGEGGGGGCSGCRGHVYVYGWFILMYGWNHHNVVK